MKVLLTQLRNRSEDAAKNFRGVTKLIERSRIGVSREDIVVLPELIGGAASEELVCYRVDKGAKAVATAETVNIKSNAAKTTSHASGESGVTALGSRNQPAP
jgi:hypothetical protein